jgi:glyoxylase-like metal-dependent hydrolase (beta-lactamase superfamily II)
VHPEVTLLKSGSLLRDEDGRILDARASVTLITSGGKRIVVDTGVAGEERILLDRLAEEGLKPDDIEIVINTHSHPDHSGNNGLFRRARLLIPVEGDTPAPGVRIIETPGHTMESISVVVDPLKIVVAGDALPTFSNFLKSVPPAIHVDRDLAAASMYRILSIADVVVPGHDRPFSVSKRRYVALDHPRVQPEGCES